VRKRLYLALIVLVIQLLALGGVAGRSTLARSGPAPDTLVGHRDLESDTLKSMGC